MFPQGEEPELPPSALAFGISIGSFSIDTYFRNIIRPAFQHSCHVRRYCHWRIAPVILIGSWRERGLE